MHHSRSCLFGREDTRIQRLSYLEDGCVRAEDHCLLQGIDSMAADAVPLELQLECTCMIIDFLYQLAAM